jgi:glycine amidinotransferase
MKANSWTEFQPLKEVILGKAYSSDDITTEHFPDDELRNGLKKIFDETEEDVLKVKEFLESIGVNVRRPKVVFDLNKRRGFCNLHTFEFAFPDHPLQPRDTAGVYGDTLIDFYTGNNGRFFSNWSTYDYFVEYYKAGNNWLSMPMPNFDSDTKQYDEHDGQRLLYHSANLLRCGHDIFYSLVHPSQGRHIGKGTDLGMEWIQRALGDKFRFHPVNHGGHLDGKLALLKPGVVACWNKNVIPDIMKSWDIIQIPDTAFSLPEEFRNTRKKRWYKGFVSDYLTEWIGFCDETVFDVNMFSVSEELVITNGYNKEIYDQFAKAGIEGWPWHFRHQHFWDGAIHCLTMDTIRVGGQEDYFS